LFIRMITPADSARASLSANRLYWLTDTMANGGAPGLSTADHTDFYLHNDVLYHKFDLFSVLRSCLPLYFGVGGLVKFRDDNQHNQF